MNHGKLVLKNYMINTLVELLSTPLAGQIARQRNRFIVMLYDRAKDLEAKRNELLKKYGDLTPEGELQSGDDGQYKLKDVEGFEKEFAVMTQGTFELQCKAEQLMVFQTVHQILENLQTPMTVPTTTVYDEICTAFETWAESEKGDAALAVSTTKS